MHLGDSGRIVNSCLVSQTILKTVGKGKTTISCRDGTCAHPIADDHEGHPYADNSLVS